tara:strand:- start:4439 stop:4852 length:414 start_codon:yes stop_codon:yes gene_type:complete
MKNLLRMSKGKRRFNGFTLVELVVVVAVVGVLAAVAAPKLLGVGSSARQAQLNSLAGAMSSAAAGNYSKRQASGTTATGTIAIANCNQVGALLDVTLDAIKYEVESANTSTTAAVTCTVKTKASPILESEFSVYGTL